MPDFLSRLVKRTFGLIPVAQPVTGSMFAPMPIENDYMQGLARDSERVSNKESIHIESARETGIISQHDGQPALKKSLNKIPDKQPVPVQYAESGSPDKDGAKPSNQTEDRDSQGDLTSILPHNIPPLKQNGTTKLARDEELLYHVDSDTLESVKYREQFHNIEPDSQGHVEPEEKDFADVRENRNTFMPVLKPIHNKEPPQSPETGSLEWAPSHPVSVQKNRNINRNVFTREMELPYDNAGKHTGSKSPGDSWQNEPLIDNADSPVDKKLMGHISDSSLLHESLLSLKSGGPILQNSEPGADSSQPGYLHPNIPSLIASQQNPKRVNNPKVNATLEQMGNMLIDRHAVAPRQPSTQPTVKVTIGRIEVKAVTPQPQTPPPRRHPVLSLDDYLKQYNG